MEYHGIKERLMKELNELFGPCDVIQELSHEIYQAILFGKLPPVHCRNGNDVGCLMKAQRFVKSGDTAMNTWHEHYMQQGVPHIVIKKRRGKDGHFTFELWKERRIYDSP